MRCSRFLPAVPTTTAVLSVLLVGGCAAADADGEESAGERTEREWTVELPVNRLNPLDEEDGFIPEGEALSPSDDVPALSRLDPELLAAVREAADAAEADGIGAVVTSGWRSERYQRFLLESAVEVYGSEEEAARWVASPEESSHVTGTAVDIGRTDAAYWFAQHGWRFGLCQTYENEIWHYELTVEPGGTCPSPLADAAAG